MGPILSALVGLMTSPAISWLFDAETLGFYSLINTLVGIVVIISCLGLDSAYLREYHEVENKNTLLTSVVLIPFSLVFLAVMILFLFNETSYSFSIFEMIFIGLFLLSSTANRFISVALRMEENNLEYSLSLFLNKLIVLVLLVLFYFLGMSGLYAVSYSLLISSLLLLMFIRSVNSKPTIPDYDSFNSAKKYLNYGMPFMLSSLVYFAMMGVDKLFIAKFLTVSDLGLYAVALVIPAVFYMFHSIIAVLWNPFIYKLKLQLKMENKKLANNIFGIINLVFTFFIFLYVIIYLIKDYILLLFPSEFSSASNLLPLTLIVPIFYILLEMTTVGIHLVKKPKIILITALISLIVNLISTYLLINFYGLYGVALASVIGMFTLFCSRLYFNQMVWLGRNYHQIIFKCICLFLFVVFDYKFSNNGYDFVACIIFFFVILGVDVFSKFYNVSIIELRRQFAK